MSLIRTKYWIIMGNARIRTVLSQCFDCRRLHGPSMNQKMADLPCDRVLQNEHPFSSVGIDFFGPYIIKRGRSEVKRYGCIFTCLAMRAVHIEVTHTLETDSFINALRRFTSRRGTPKLIRSDNGTNLVGAEKEIREAINK